VQLIHQALPELNDADIDTRVEFFGKQLKAPLMITSMTGGAQATGELNQGLAALAEQCGIGFAVGSQRILLERPEALADFAVRRHIPSGVLLGNIGGVQLPQIPLEHIVELVKKIEADGICVHLNAAQEMCQPEGDRCFRGILDGIARLVERLEGRVLVKETGAGLSAHDIAKLSAVGVKYLDLAGAGGTSWTKVEMQRLAAGPQRQLGETFAAWGNPTAFCLLLAKKICPAQTCIIGSGGIFNGLDGARAIALGASLVGLARPVLQAWHSGGKEGAKDYIERLQRELQTAMLLTGSANLTALQRAERIYTGELRQWIAGSSLVCAN
jgi:isopentenyl-diphosphate delta-isomerase